MEQQLETLLASLKKGETPFAKVLEFIDANYQHQPTAFKNGDAYNESTQNQGSARVFAFAKLNNLNAEDTLHLFAEHYKAVLDTPDGTDHQNIRQFMANGCAGITFEGEALKVK
ncbi:HopJ type III effector protein [Mucilaginibacter auburnensis]|uniref:HopJ type III effector protein n=1 Tax=Mucilaginibacter auburnensis TaxID=1457233 RepID=A0A2H9VNZ3_9SPHI|nr:HopJ type III effector protein [Mucilaginibacter auburnensis]PJJ80031.1 HopJ type III effector protein [Mucilaginibacter auburnensis]